MTPQRDWIDYFSICPGFLQALVIPLTAVLYRYMQRRSRRQALKAQLAFELDRNIHLAQGSAKIYQQKIERLRLEGKNPEVDPALAARPSGWRSSVFDAYRDEIWDLFPLELGEALQRAYDKMLQGLWKGDDQIPPAKAKKEFEEVLSLLEAAREKLRD